MYFFEHNLEIYRPAQMIVAGLVHTNSRLLVSGSSDSAGAEIEFTGNLSYAGSTPGTPGYSTTEPPLGGPAWAGFSVAAAPGYMEAPTYSNGGASAQVSSVERYEPLGKAPASVLDTTDANPNNDSFMELIEPPVSGYVDPPEIARRRLYNKAGVIFSINGTTVTVTTQNGTALNATQVTNLKAAFTGKTTVFDQREGKNVDMSNINVAAMTTVLNGATGFNGVLYIYDTTPVNALDPEPKTIRLKSGGVLPNTGLTVASQNPVYVQGDYNTGTTTNPNSVPANSTGNPNNTSSPVVSGYTRKPAAIAADAVILLSNSWNDANAALAVTSRVASNTTYNMAILAGFMPSGYDPDGSGGVAAYGYSGGANNFPRFLESWTSKSCTYFGSMVELFQSKVFTGKWDTGVIYRPPNRRWNFDNNFVATPPPGSLDAVAISRGGWSKYSPMKSFLTVLSFAALAAGPSRADLDLTPHIKDLGAGLLDRVYFSEGSTNFAVTLDGETKVSAQNGGAEFRFTPFSLASMRLRPTPMPQRLPFDEKGLAEYAKAAEALLPLSAEGRELVWQGDNVLPVNRWQSHRFIYAYHVAGVAYEDCITFLNLESGQQIVIQTGAQRKDFATVAARADDMFRRWHEVLPGDEQGLN
jgi:hypothetical protein